MAGGYSISQVAKRFGVEPHTLRFYEKEGIVSPEHLPSGIRVYSEENISQMEMVMCLKSTGMPLKDIKRYFDLVEAGDSTLDARLRIFTDHRQHVLDQIEELQKYLCKIERKIDWYQGFIRERRKELGETSGREAG